MKGSILRDERKAIAIIGCGHVGMACAQSLVDSRLIRELVLIDTAVDRAKGEALDLQQAVPLGMPVKVTAGTYADAAGSVIAILTVGAPGAFRGSRLVMLSDNVRLVRDCVARLMVAKFDGVILITTNPVDVLAFIAQSESACLSVGSSGPAPCLIRNGSVPFSAQSCRSKRAPCISVSSVSMGILPSQCGVRRR